MIALNNSRQEELMNLLDTLEEYLEFGSTDGKPYRQVLREKLKVLGSTVRHRIFQSGKEAREREDRGRYTF